MWPVTFRSVGFWGVSYQAKRIREDYSCPTDTQARFLCLGLPFANGRNRRCCNINKIQEGGPHPATLASTLPPAPLPSTFGSVSGILPVFLGAELYSSCSNTPPPRLTSGLPAALGQVGNINEIIEPFLLHLHLLNLIYSSIQLTFCFSGQAVVLMRAMNSKAKQPPSSY